MECEKCGLHLEPGSERYTVELCPLHEAAGELLEKLEKAGRMLNLHVGEFEDPNAVYLELDIETLIAKVKGERVEGEKT